ncbi:MAG: hypothetical protein WBC88_10330 [Candidatus Zixiibacteriota bacterium]
MSKKETPIEPPQEVTPACAGWHSTLLEIKELVDSQEWTTVVARSDGSPEIKT